ncbi:uncharacterized protein [Littorina saxatilis]|uniref:uncharacterized protein n=1 Tax=Littorina saxatilis TaxID=31220 RepID=UPI0038B5854D
MVDLVQRTFAENWNNPSVSAYIDPSAQLDQHASAGPATSRRRNPNVRPPSSLKEQPHHRPEDLLRRSGRSRAMTEKGFKDVLRTRIDNFNQAIKSIKRLIQSTVSVLNDKHDDVVFLRQVQTKLVKKMSEIRTLQARIEELRSDPRTVEALEEIETQAATLVSQLVVEIARNNPPSGRLGRPSTNSGRRKGGSDISHSTHSRIQRTEQESIKVKMEMQVLQLKTEAQLEREEEEAEASLRALQEEQEHRESERRKEKRRREFEEAEAQEEDKRRIERIRQKLVDSKRKAERQSFFEERKLLVIQAANNDAMNALVANSRSSESSMTIFSEYEMEDPTPDLSRKQRSTADWVQSTVDQLSTTEKKLPLSPLVKQGKSRQVLQVDRSSNQQEVRATDGTTAATEKTDDHSRDQNPGLSARDGTFVPFSNITTTTKKVLPEIVRRQPTQTATGVQHHFTEAAYTTASLNPSYGGIPAIRERQLTRTQSAPRPPFTQSTWTGVSTTTANVGGYVNAATTYYAEPHQPRVLATSEAVGGHVNAAATYYAEPHQPRVLATSEAVGGHVNAAAAYNAEPHQPHGLTTSAGVGSYVDYYMAKNYEPPQKDSPQQSKLRHDAPIFTQVAAGQQYDTAHSVEARHVIYGNSEAEPPVVTPHPKRPSYTSEQMNSTNASGEDQLRMITQTFSNAMTLSRLPTQEPSIFVGDPLDYPSWHAAFTFLIGSHNIQETEKLLYLKRFLGGSALESISGFFLMRKPEAFTSAMKMLEARYGNSFAIGQAFRTKLENWDTVRSEDPVALRLFSDFLRQCSVAQNEIGGLHILDDAQYLKRMVDKLPKYIKNRWSRKVTHDKVKHPERYPTFKELSDFVEEEAEISNEPVFGMIANKTAPKFDPVDAQKQQLYRRDKGLRQNRLESGAQSISNHLLNSVQPTGNDLASGGQPTDKLPCMYCEMSNHELPSCRKFAGLSKEDKRGYVMRNRLCFGCLKAAGHVASQCKEREVCSKCKKNHPTSMHLDIFQHESFGSPRETNQSVKQRQ